MSRSLRFGLIGFVALIVGSHGAFADSCLAQSRMGRGRVVVWPSGGIAFPAGRFGKIDAEASPPKTGHQSGYALGVDVGYGLSPSLLIGVEVAYSRFGIDYGTEIPNPLGAEGQTSTIVGGIWARYFLNAGFSRWRPYVVVGVSVGRPAATLDYEQPRSFIYPDMTVFGASIESVVSSSFGFTGGLGVMVPLASNLAVAVEPRYRTISSKGAGRTEKVTTIDGDVFESTVGSVSGVPTPLKAKSNTDWWEVRAGLVLML